MTKQHIIGHDLKYGQTNICQPLRKFDIAPKLICIENYTWLVRRGKQAYYVGFIDILGINILF